MKVTVHHGSDGSLPVSVCDGDTTAMTAATQPTLEVLLRKRGVTTVAERAT